MARQGGCDFVGKARREYRAQRSNVSLTEPVARTEFAAPSKKQANGTSGAGTKSSNSSLSENGYGITSMVCIHMVSGQCVDIR